MPARGKALVDTQLSIAVPADTYGRVAPRSGLGKSATHRSAHAHKGTRLTRRVAASKHMIDTGAGVIDADYRGEVKVCLINLDPDQPITLHRGDRIAQLVIQQVSLCDVEEVTDVADLGDTVRGAGGYGSTGA